MKHLMQILPLIFAIACSSPENVDKSEAKQRSGSDNVKNENIGDARPESDSIVAPEQELVLQYYLACVGPNGPFTGQEFEASPNKPIIAVKDMNDNWLGYKDLSKIKIEKAYPWTQLFVRIKKKPENNSYRLFTCQDDGSHDCKKSSTAIIQLLNYTYPYTIALPYPSTCIKTK